MQTPSRVCLGVLAAVALPAASTAFEIVINPGAGLQGNAAALAAFDRAAALWEARIIDPIVIRIDADLTNLGPGVIGQASSTFLLGDNFAEIRDAMVADAVAEGGDAVVEALPTFEQLDVLVPSGRTVIDSMTSTQANLKALGFQGVEAISGNNEDAVILFNVAFTFDFDNRDGVNPFAYDFETAAAHEIGHALGFISAVDDLDETTSTNLPEFRLTTMDLFRFRSSAGGNPTTLQQFTSFPRSVQPGVAEHFDDLANEWDFSTGQNRGDGQQASHWKDDELTGNFIGLMDPTLAFGVIERPSEADFRVLDVIGYNVVPEPAAGVLLALVMPLLAGRRRSASRSAQS